MLSFQSCLFLITQKRHRAGFRLPGVVGHSRVCEEYCKRKLLIARTRQIQLFMVIHEC